MSNSLTNDVLSLVSYIRSKITKQDEQQVNYLCFVAFGLYGAMHKGEYLFNDPILASKEGPKIAGLSENFPLDSNNASILSNAKTDCIDLVLKIYAKHNVNTLQELLCEENTPWANSYQEGKVFKIPKADIIAYYQLAYDSAKVAIGLQDVYQVLAKT